MNILVAARLNSEYKLRMTLDPIIHLDCVDQIFLVRRYPIQLPKTICYSPPSLLRKSIITTELYRIWMIFYLCLTQKVNCLMGIHFIFHCVYVALAKMIFRIPLIMLIIESPDKYRRKGLFKFFLRRADLIGVRGNHSRKHILDLTGLDDHKVFITPDIHEFNHVQNNSQPKIYDLIFVGYYTQAKRLDILLDVLDKVRKKIPNVKLAMVGDGPLSDMVTRKIKELDLAGNIDRLGFVEKIDDYLNRSKIFIMTSQTEGLPTVLLEAMQFGLPLIVPDVGDIKDLAINGQNAIVVEPLKTEQFADACVQLLTNESLYNRMVENTRKMFSEKQKNHTAGHVWNVWKRHIESSIKLS
ncbi:MAG: glycosyltransferase family 4 protein [Candidatus Omnitrophica bacterium]|nr:glycosyltransferase family 4 protein [Candidatus Omnitrophota bacterium]